MATHPKSHAENPHAENHAAEPARPPEADTPPPPLRRIIQVSVNNTGNGGLIALCDDGTLWAGSALVNQWSQIDTTVVENAAVVSPAGPIPMAA